MTLAEWVAADGRTVDQVAAELGIHRTSLHRYMSGAHMPRAWMCARITTLTGGAVTANDLAAARYDRRVSEQETAR